MATLPIAAPDILTDTLTPVEFNDTLRTIRLSPEKALMLAILKDAIWNLK